MSNPGLPLPLAAALRRRLAMIASVAGVMILLGYWVAMALPNYYRSSATIFVATQEINQRLAESGATPFDPGIGLHRVTSQVLSRSRLSELIDELHLYEQPPRDPGLGESKRLPLDEAIERVRSSVQVIPVETGIARADPQGGAAAGSFRISFAHRNPKLAAAVAQRLAEAFVEEYTDWRVALGRKGLELIEIEWERQRDEYRSAEAKIAEFNAANAGRLPEELTTNQRMLDDVRDGLRQAQRQRERAQNQETFWDAEVLATAASSRVAANVDLARGLQRLQLQLAEFRARGFTDRHPGVIRAGREIRELRDQIQADETIRDQPSRADLAHQNAEAQRSWAALDVEMSTREVARLEARVDLLEQRLDATPEVALKSSALHEASRQIARNLEALADRRLEASLQVDVEASQLVEQFRIVDPALPPQKPSSPDRLWVILIGVIAGIGSGVAAAWVAEANDSSFHALRDVKSAFQIPVLALIPDIVFPADRTARRRRRVRNALAASGVAAFCLTGGAATYAYVNGMPDWLCEAMEARELDGRTGARGTRTPLQDLRWLTSPDSARSPQAREV